MHSMWSSLEAGRAATIAPSGWGQLGLKAACVDSRGTFGGTCLNIGCIPSKALLHASDLYTLAKNDFARFGIKGTYDVDLKTMMAHKERSSAN
jgi:dihydrolipoamide dehydrogenase